MEKEWDKMMAWLNSDDETATNVKYLVALGMSLMVSVSTQGTSAISVHPCPSTTPMPPT